MRLPDKATRKLSHHQRVGSINAGISLVACVLAGTSFCLAAYFGASDTTELSSTAEPSRLHSVSRTIAEPSARHPVVVRKPAGPPQVFTGLTDPHGAAVTVSCSTCHATRRPNSSNKSVTDLNEFHGSLKLAHGQISCLSCHNAADYDALKLADGSRIEFSEVMNLCAQCHGQQMRDYEHNVHGGMNGHWDLSRGPRQKLNCVDCHNPHTPQFPRMQPTFKPRDRFLDQQH